MEMHSSMQYNLKLFLASGKTVIYNNKFNRRERRSQGAYTHLTAVTQQSPTIRYSTSVFWFADPVDITETKQYIII